MSGVRTRTGIGIELRSKALHTRRHSRMVIRSISIPIHRFIVFGMTLIGCATTHEPANAGESVGASVDACTQFATEVVPGLCLCVPPHVAVSDGTEMSCIEKPPLPSSNEVVAKTPEVIDICECLDSNATGTWINKQKCSCSCNAGFTGVSWGSELSCVPNAATRPWERDQTDPDGGGPGDGRPERSRCMACRQQTLIRCARASATYTRCLGQAETKAKDTCVRLFHSGRGIFDPGFSAPFVQPFGTAYEIPDESSRCTEWERNEPENIEEICPFLGHENPRRNFCRDSFSRCVGWQRSLVVPGEQCVSFFLEDHISVSGVALPFEIGFDYNGNEGFRTVLCAKPFADRERQCTLDVFECDNICEAERLDGEKHEVQTDPASPPPSGSEPEPRDTDDLEESPVCRAKPWMCAPE